MFLRLALSSLLDRKGSVLLSILAMTVSVLVMLGVEHVRHQAKSSFSSSVSGVDLVVGARTGSLNLLLYSVFGIGNPTNNVRWSSYQAIESNPRVKWAVPMSLGDSHKGYRVLGTSVGFFDHFSYGQKQSLEFREGNPFDDVFDVVLGAQVAKQLGYGLGREVVLAHGVAKTSFSLHDDRPFKVVGILKPTGTPVDQKLFVSLAGIEAIHIDWQQGVRSPRLAKTMEDVRAADLTPKSITAMMLGLDSRLATFAVQRSINNFRAEPLMAILPGVALSELWQMMAILENTLRMVSALVFLAACLGVSALMLSSIRERRREIQLLRTVGAGPGFLFGLVQLEVLLITSVSMLAGIGLLFLGLTFSHDYLINEFGLHLSTRVQLEQSSGLVLGVAVASFLAALLPSIQASRSAVKVNMG